MHEPNPRMSVEHCLLAGFTLDAIERHVRKWAIIKTLKQFEGHHGRTAEALGMHRNTLTRLIKELRIVVKVNGVKDSKYKSKSQLRLFSE